MWGGREEGRDAGEDETSDGGCEVEGDGAGALLELWNNFLISTLLGLGGADVVVEVDDVFAADGAGDEDLPLAAGVSAATEPNDFTPSDLIGGTEAGEEEMGADASFIEPKVTAEPRKIED